MKSLSTATDACASDHSTARIVKVGARFSCLAVVDDFFEDMSKEGTVARCF